MLFSKERFFNKDVRMNIIYWMQMFEHAVQSCCAKNSIVVLLFVIITFDSEHFLGGFWYLEYLVQFSQNTVLYFYNFCW